MTLSKEQEASKPLGTVWVDCQWVAPPLRKALKMAAEVVKLIDGEQRFSQEETPSSIVLCADEREDIATGVRRLRALAPRTPIVAFSSSEEPHLAEEALRSGATGYVHAEMRPDQIVLALSLVSRGEIAIPRRLLKELVGLRLFLRRPKLLEDP